ncbi:unnamed protein product, partial [Ectocarpus sp. 13 AM-2016]
VVLLGRDGVCVGGGGIRRGYGTGTLSCRVCAHQPEKKRGTGGGVVEAREKARGTLHNERHPPGNKGRSMFVRTCKSLVMALQEECSGRG